MNDSSEPLEEAMDSAAEAAEEAAQGAQEATKPADETAGSFEERVEDAVSKAGNFMARDITDDPSADSNDRTWSLIAYLSQVIIPIIAPVLMLVLEPNKNRPFQKYHAVQSLGFVVAAAIYEAAAGVVFTVLSIITLGCLGAVLWILFLVPLVPAIYYAYLAYQGKRFDIPYLTKFMRGQGWL